MLTQVLKTVETRRLLHRGQAVLVAVSGGADSVALLAVLRQLARPWRFRLTVAHLHHGIRGAAADCDAAFVRSLARRLRLPVIVERADVPALARQRGVSLEMAGREARYAFFQRAAAQAGADVVATAHTADDQAETILLKLARGAGPDGLAGIPFRTRRGKLTIVRPLREVNRAAILLFLRRHRLPWREDASNRDKKFLRNRVRHDILPRLEKALNPRLREALLRTGEILSAENEWLDRLAAGLLRRCLPFHGRTNVCLLTTPLLNEPVAACRRVLRQWLALNGAEVETVDFDAIERVRELLMKKSGAVTLPGDILVRRTATGLQLRHPGPQADSAPLVPTGYPICQSRGGAVLNAAHSRYKTGSTKCTRTVEPTPLRAEQALRLPRFLRGRLFSGAGPVVLNIPGETLLPAFGCRLTATIRPGIIRERPAGIGRHPVRASVSEEVRAGRAVIARAWKPGDRMRPFGMTGSKKLQDIFTDAKLPAELRHRVPILECGGEIVWVPGYRIARRWAVKNARTPALRLRVEKIG